MIPVLLEFQAFGPFLKKQTIDFRRFDDSRMFLISGPTGCGKTTIFDAITYCLYGKASGALRTTDTFKSDYADESVLCYASFTFLVHGKQYTVLREPAQIRAKQRGEGFLTKSASAELSNESGVICTQVSQVNSKIESLLGLNFDQFCKIVMLPQGEFRKFLSDSSEEKQKILRQIFSTDLLNRFTEQLKQNASQAKAAQDTLYAQCNALVKTLLAEPDTPLAESMREEPYHFEQILSALSDQNEAASTQLLSLTQSRQTHTEQIRALNLDHARSLYEQFVQYDMAQRAFATLEAQRGEMYERSLHIKLLTAAKDAAVLEQAKADAASRCELLIKKRAQANIQREEGARKLSDAQLARTQAQQSAASLPAQNDKLLKLRKQRDDAARLETLLSLAQEAAAQRTAIVLKLSALDTALEYQTLFHQEEELAQSIQQSQRFFDAVKSYQSARDAWTSASMQASNTLKRYLAAQAGILADTLTDGAPCPVCGSIDHPKKAVLPAYTPTREEVDRDSDAEKAAQAAVESANHQVLLLFSGTDKTLSLPDMVKTEQELQNERTLVLEQLQSKRFSLSADDSLVRLPNETLTAKKDAYQAKLSELNGQIAAREEERNALISLIGDKRHTTAEMQSQIDLLAAAIKQIEQDKQAAEDAFQAAQTEYARFITLCEQIDVQIDDARAQKKDADEAFSLALQKAELPLNDYLLLKPQLASLPARSEQVETYRTEYQSQKKLVRFLTNSLNGQTRPDMEALEIQYSTLSQTLHTIEQSYEALSNRTAQNRRAFDTLKTLYAEFQAAQSDFEQKKFIYDIANGTYTEKVNFERYVLASYFDAVIAHANLRLEQMTYSRYTLNRRTERESKNRTSGLALEVFDAYTGSTRHVNSLSGGEGFKVSLCLALGLADIISETAGGIEIGTMFIDEGFGSLDSDSLDAAITCLYELQQSGRYLGIISHVNELKERIPQKIVIAAHPTGSIIETQSP